MQKTIQKMIERLYTMEDGDKISTQQLFYFDHDENIDIDMMKLHEQFLKKAEENGIICDMSEHEYSLEGLPYSLEFTIRKTK